MAQPLGLPVVYRGRPEYTAAFTSKAFWVKSRDKDTGEWKSYLVRHRSMTLSTDHPNPLTREWRVSVWKGTFPVFADDVRDRTLDYPGLERFLRALGFQQPASTIGRLLG